VILLILLFDFFNGLPLPPPFATPPEPPSSRGAANLSKLSIVEEVGGVEGVVGVAASLTVVLAFLGEKCRVGVEVFAEVDE